MMASIVGYGPHGLLWWPPGLAMDRQSVVVSTGVSRRPPGCSSGFRCRLRTTKLAFLRPLG